MSFFEKLHKKLVSLLFPVMGRFSPIISLVLILTAWSIPEAYWSVRIILAWLFLVNSEIYFAGILERDHLPIQPGNSVFYRIYRFLDGAILFFLLLWLILILLPEPSLQVKAQFSIVILMVWILRAIGDRKYRPKKPEE